LGTGNRTRVLMLKMTGNGGWGGRRAGAEGEGGCFGAVQALGCYDRIIRRVIGVLKECGHWVNVELADRAEVSAAGTDLCANERGKLTDLRRS
jgi:hypothetical protein